MRVYPCNYTDKRHRSQKKSSLIRQATGRKSKMSQIFQVDADQLYQVSSLFYANARLAEETLRDFMGHVQDLHGYWQGQGATAFFDEMEGHIEPALKSMLEAMSQCTEQVNQLMKQAVEAEHFIKGRLAKQA
jgi:WXG100 family type VII secretion target